MKKCASYLTLRMYRNKSILLALIIIVTITVLFSENKPKNIYKNKFTEINTIEHRFKKRYSIFTSECTKIKQNQQTTSKLLNPNFKFPQYILTTQKYNTLACLPMKTGCSSWFFAFHELEHPNTTLAKNQGFGYIAALPKFKDKKQEDEVRTNESKFLKFLTTRHPLTRLYSGWNEHMRVEKGRPIGNQWKAFKLDDKSKWGETHICSWDKFLELFVSGEYNIDGHHKPVSELCLNCEIEWDYILKQETMDQDNEYILNLINAPTGFQLGQRNSYGVKKDPYSSLINYCNVSNDVIEKLEKYYENDYKLYGYEKFDRSEVC